MRYPDTPISTFKRLRRSQHIVRVLVRHGFGEALARIRVWECINIERRLLRRACELPQFTLPERIRLALEELGPTFVKLGQMLSTRPDLVPPEIIIELKKLQSSVHFIPTKVIKGVIEAELGKPINEVFDSFDEEPLAAASLAQVHRAIYKGKLVVLKVQRPNIEKTIEEDIGIMHTLAVFAERYSPAAYLSNPVGLVAEFADQIKKELDFRMEANNMRRFARNFAGDETIHIPEAYTELCTKHLVTMEYIDGINISDVRRLKDEGYDLNLITKRGAIIEFKSTFEYGFFHADPHPGNIFVLPDNVIGLVDFGMMATFSLRDRQRLAKLVYFIAIRDERRVARALNELMESEDIIPSEKLEPTISAIIQEHADVPMSEFRLAAMLFGMMQAIMAQGARLRPQLLWLTKSIAIQEDVARSFKTDFNMIQFGRPYAKKVLTDKFNPVRHPEEMFLWLEDGLDVIRDMPYDIGILLREMTKGKLKIEFQHIGLEPIRLTLNHVANLLSLTITLAALLISSSVIVLARVPPFIGSIPVIAFIGYLGALFIGAIMAISILFRSR